MIKSAKYLTSHFSAPVIGDSMILYKSVIQKRSGKLFSDWDRHFQYTLGKVAKPRWEVAHSGCGVCASGVHVGSLDFAKRFGSHIHCERGEKVVILACQVKIEDMVATDSSHKVRCKAILPLGIVQE